ncbi:ACP phosphodiesterase [Roseivirga sp. UBA838]|uniref:acyl carrier protein phosphodiesterase n=2 Tax=Roseivirgaceae TaxID=2762306 RepID=UPI003BEEE627
MNFLAHLYLSGPNAQLTVGNFMGDFVKGSQLGHLPEMVAKGVILHREIDHYTDHHPIVGLSKDKLRLKYRHYAGVIVDMYYDHFLAKNFNEYSSQPLWAFAQEKYELLQANYEFIPPRGQHMLPYMIKGDWLTNYARKEGLHRSLTGLSRRTKFNSKLELAIQDLTEHYSVFETEFREFFTEIREHISQFRQDLINSKL